MKKILCIFVCAFLVCAALTISVCAEDGVGEAEILPEITPEELPTDDVQSDTNEHHSLFTRVWEAFSDNYETILALFADGVVVAIALMMTKGGKGLAVRMMSTISKGASEDTQSKLVSAFNELIGENTELREKVNSLESIVSKANAELVNVHKETRAVLESMFNVWTQSSSLPQCIKEIVTTNYANCIKSEDVSDERKDS